MTETAAREGKGGRLRSVERPTRHLPNCAPPAHTKVYGTGETEQERQSDIFEFVCAEEWHDHFVGYSYDRSNHRTGRYDRQGLVQSGAIISLACGLSSWIYPDHVLIDMGEIKFPIPIYVGDKIRLTFRNRAPQGVRYIDIKLEVFREEEWHAVCSTRAVITRFIPPIRKDYVEAPDQSA